MPFPEHLLEQAEHLAKREKQRPRQARLRRAVSTAYYALFHLLIHEATLNWKQVDQRATLARFFEHGKMKAASERQMKACKDFFKATPGPAQGQEWDCFYHLQKIAGTFVQSQQQRHTADYDNATQWTRTEVETQVSLVREAFGSWKAIRKQPLAQAYLLSLLGLPRG